MTGLSVLYAKQAREEKGWDEVPDRDRPGRLREVYWAGAAKGKLVEGKSFFGMSFDYRTDRKEIGRKIDDPGDSFIHIVEITGKAESNFEWVEVTEVFTTTPAKTIEGAMRAWNGIKDKQTIDFEKFKKGLKRGRPSRGQQRKAADDVIKAIKKKITKTSYNEVVDRYGYGTLVVGMPLWFATLPENPFRAENALDDFMVRTAIGLEEIGRNELRRKKCPFKHVLVLWDITPEAIEEWDKKKSREYENAENTTLMNPIPISTLASFAEILKKAIKQTGIVESEAPSFSYFLGKKIEKNKKGKGPYPFMTYVMEKMAKEMNDNLRRRGVREKLKQRISLGLCQALCFIKIHGIVGLERWLAQKISPKRYWRIKVLRRRTLRLYRESVKKHRRMNNRANCR